MTFASPFSRVFERPFGGVPSSATILPTDITGCVLWYDCSDIDTMFTDAGTTNVVNNNDLIYQLNDKSGQNNHATQTTENKRPLYSTNIQNSLSAAYADGVNDSMVVPSLTLTNYTVFVSYKYLVRATINVAAAWDNYPASPRQGLLIMAFNGDQMDYEGYVAGTGGLVANTGTPTGNASYSWDLERNGTAITANRNGSALTGLTVGAGAFSMTGHRLFNHYFTSAEQNQWGKMYLYEYIIYNSALGASDLALVRTYLNTKWAMY